MIVIRHIVMTEPSLGKSFPFPPQSRRIFRLGQDGFQHPDNRKIRRFNDLLTLRHPHPRATSCSLAYLRQIPCQWSQLPIDGRWECVLEEIGSGEENWKQREVGRDEIGSIPMSRSWNCRWLIDSGLENHAPIDDLVWWNCLCRVRSLPSDAFRLP